MKTITVTELLETTCLLAPEKGALLASEIRNSLGFFSHAVVVDFAGYQFLSSAFLNHAFGQLCIDEDWDIEDFRKKISVKGLDEDDLNELELAIDNAEVRRKLMKKGIDPEEYYSRRIPA
jgi:hypothetical protein